MDRSNDRHTTAADDAPRVLVADADPFARDAIQRALGDKYEVILCGDGETALTEARRQPPDLIILDLLLPKLDGVQLLRKLKNDPLTAEVPVLVFTSLLAEELSQTAGADAFLSKPLRRSTFLAKVQELLRKTKPGKEECECNDW